MTAIAGANQYSGKTTCNTARAAIQYSGLYPDEWTGLRWQKPIIAAAASKTLEKLRDTVMSKIFGTKAELGSGWLPMKCIDPDKITWGTGKDKGVIQHAFVKWFDSTGTDRGWTELFAFSYEQGWERVSGYTLNDVLLSEEPKDIQMHDELKARTNTTGGQLVMDMIPLLGETQLYLAYEQDRTGTRDLITITIDDCLHLSEEEIAQAKLEGENDPWAEARLYGRPVRGQGMIFNVPERNLIMKAERSVWPSYFKTIIGIDIPHTNGAFAAVQIVFDPEKDVIYVVECVKVWDTPREVHADRMKAMGGTKIPIAWPHDAGRGQGDGVSGGSVASRYNTLGCNVLKEAAYMIGWDGKKSNSTLDVIDDVRDRERSGRIFYSQAVRELLIERSKYSHQKGKVINAQDDHCLDAMFKGIMMLRAAAPFGRILSGYSRGSAGDRTTRRNNKDFFDI